MAAPRFDTFTQLLRARAAELAEQDVHVHLRDAPGGPVAEHLTYGRLDREARRIASCLQSLGATGEPVLLLHTSTTRFLTAFAACLYAGAVAVPAPMPGDGGHGKRLHRAGSVLADTGARLVLTDSEGAPEVSLWLAQANRQDVVCLAIDLPELGAPEDWREVPAGPDDLAFLQYTSGSVADPRGVMVTHRNLLANQESLRSLLGTTAADRFGSWLPYYHDMGLIAHLLHPVLLGSFSVQVAPDSFVRRPLRWLQAIERYGVTVAGGPNFCYDLCVRRITDEQLAGLDLSRWRLALNGAEPVRAESLRAFAERFAPTGFDPGALFPAYGLAEATLVVSGGEPGAGPTERVVDPLALERDQLLPALPGRPARTLVGCGRPVGLRARIVDPTTRRALPDGAVGEIWLRGESVARGYWKRPGESELTFAAALADGEGPFLRTGDLGVLDEGELFVTGRLKELVILNGRNIYPQDIEWAARSVRPALTLGFGAAFAVEADREQLVLVQEVRGAGADPQALRTLAHAIQALIGREFSIPAGNVLLVPPGTVRRTTSGKVQRTTMRRLFLAGALQGEYEVLTPQVHELVRSRAVELGDDLLPPLTAEGARAW
ncbi:fatty acyl-AMP ligase [Kitasatospora sp. NBC_01287]|uniref:fatty acyl-AMP ligase n=1 Tax=Kitasatospora sp. NBC_01287 TaxID=2903573 RepID=UPI00224FD380|nr:fatty acyl-AMP ligase [Kitasatospora sp. NBC_01287]MCX4750329.1 fatty acyl-AMP ligase [Kitasatospora sp. NBC_01287]